MKNLTRTVRVTLEIDRFLALQRLASEDGNTISGALAWLANYAVMQNSLCPLATPQNMPTSEVLRRINLALQEPYEPNQPGHMIEAHP